MYRDAVVDFDEAVHNPFEFGQFGEWHHQTSFRRWSALRAAGSLQTLRPEPTICGNEGAEREAFAFNAFA
jgi:hypothetical protein